MYIPFDQKYYKNTFAIMAFLLAQTVMENRYIEEKKAQMESW